ncbi:TPA: zonular occludens toxin domain-containing protein [Neisseria subflava]
MIYLFTGNMGTGKTSRVVSMILNNEDGLFKMKLEDGTEVDRPLYFCHIDGLDKRKFNAHELTEEEIMSAPLRDIIPQGAVLIVDEAHYTYPVRAAGRPVPPYIQELTELRHHGHTVILMTQHPSQLDVFVRNLVSKHTHLERKAVGMKQYTWYKCVTSLDNPAAVTGVESSSWKPPKDAFKYYKSSSQHQKFKKNIPLAVWALIGIFAFMAWKGYNVYQIYQQGTGQSEVVQSVSDSSSNEQQAINETDQPKIQQDINSNLKPEDFVPTLAEKPESKPIYDNVRQVKTFEYIAGCVEGGNSGCTCYSAQGTPLKEITKAMCKDYVRNGLPFNPYKDKTQTTQATQPQNQAKSNDNSQVLALGGKSPQNLMYDGYVEAGEQFQQRGGTVGSN